MTLRRVTAADAGPDTRLGLSTGAIHAALPGTLRRLFHRSLAGPERLGSARVVFICDPSAVKTIFTADPSLAPAGAGREAMEPMFGARSVLLIDGRAHMRQRKLMLPPFHGERLSRYGALMGEITREELARWPERGAFELQARMQAITLEIHPARRLGLEEDERRAVVPPPTIQRLLDIVANPLTELFAGLPERIGPIKLARTIPQNSARSRRRPARRDRAPSQRTEPREPRRHPLAAAPSPRRGRRGDERRRAPRPAGDAAARRPRDHGHALAWAFDQMLRAPDALDRATSRKRAPTPPSVLTSMRSSRRRFGCRPPIPIVDRRIAVPVELGGFQTTRRTIVAPCIYLLHHRPDTTPTLTRSTRALHRRDADTYAWLPFGGGRAALPRR